MDKVTISECPFCGNEPNSREDHGHSTAWIVSCTKDDTCPIHIIEIWGSTEQAAITAWNTRATPAPDSEKLREAATDLDRYASHHIGCALYQQSWVSGATRCSCGLDAVRTALGESA